MNIINWSTTNVHVEVRRGRLARERVFDRPEAELAADGRRARKADARQRSAVLTGGLGRLGQGRMDGEDAHKDIEWKEMVRENGTRRLVREKRMETW